ncbi:hypothetical protein DPMN_099573 [Dreissena polymorpha]|uniref:Uncharacterized protein n=1 Tax=Dreissena polymorpha TaxID=45954 RepID=A0A9D4LHI5_DREPO|nr:hypothetical protein DPMN_099573 [Dreissena polymorpha]
MEGVSLNFSNEKAVVKQLAEILREAVKEGCDYSFEVNYIYQYLSGSMVSLEASAELAEK